MKTFYCDHCGNLVFFENVQCVKCAHTLGFLPDVSDLSALEPAEANIWSALTTTARNRRYRQCQNNHGHQICNWLVPVWEEISFCIACRLNQTIPDLTISGNLERWRKIELAKRRLIYTLLHIGLSLDGKRQENRPALLSPSHGPLTPL